ARGVLDRQRDLERQASLAGGRVGARATGHEMIEPGAGFVGDRAPVIAHRPVSGRVALHEEHLGGMARDVGVRNSPIGEEHAVLVSMSSRITPSLPSTSKRALWP